MIIPKLKKNKSEKKYHDILLEDEYAWVDQPNILEVLKDANKLDPEVKSYIDANNKITDVYFEDVKDLQKNLFNEIKSKIKLDRKVLAELAYNNPEVFKSVVKKVQSSLA